MKVENQEKAKKKNLKSQKNKGQKSVGPYFDNKFDGIDL